MGDLSSIAIHCPNCGTVSAEVLGKHSWWPEDAEPGETLLAKCPKCNQPLLAEHWYFEYGMNNVTGETFGEWTDLKRVWPKPDHEVSAEFPATVRESLREAQKCLRGDAYVACAAMAGRALEGLCRDLNADDAMLAAGLKDLHDRGQIDDRLHEWGMALHEKRNIAAHPDPRPISERDARYVLDFAFAICEYVYVLTAKFEEFKKGA